MKTPLRLAALALAVTALGGAAPAPNAPAGLKVDRVVLLMRHGIRPPTKAQPMPNGVTADAWPSWPVAPGWLTPHGAAAVVAVAGADRAGFVADGLMPATACPTRVALLADSDQRTIATAQSYAAGLAPGCAIAIEHRPQDEADPLFNQIADGHAPLDPARAAAAVDAAVGPGGIAAVERSVTPLLARLDRILCGPATTQCGVAREPSTLTPATATTRPKLGGALDRASTAAQILLLEYADDKPAQDVGWGRATAADITVLGAFHALEFRLLARPPYLAARNMAGLSPRILTWLSDDAPTAPTIAMIAGHDTQVANLAGLLDLHWRVPGIAADDPVPGGAIMLERLSDARGQQYVRAVYRAQSLAELRAGTARAPYRAVLPITGCTARGVVGLCTLAAFSAKLAVR
ncbi:histidine-type phosphatase [Sphingomonas glacialis]|uniref:Histidine-type phosphatase n=1 Tax=Sphingomonas glacialis TaxID=658225 RepID=A0A502G3W5_9SPHN|nr:histidine-type phosphatase [Sphingomonas glacialis]TPG56242.1 histidine-type phosphatase [Sphingomonas glacialis]